MKPYFFEFTTQSEREFLGFPVQIQQRIKIKMEFFLNTDAPLSFAKKLQGRKDTYSFRIGDYRVIVTPKDQKTLIILLILKIGHRRKVCE